jgi:di/tricarboxylate transporter
VATWPSVDERQGSHLRTGIAEMLLQAGDTLLIQTEATRLPELRRTEDFVLLEGLHEKLELRRKAPVVLLVTVVLILLAALELVDIAFLALGAAAAMVLTRCLSPRQSYRAIDLSTLVLMGGAIALGEAIQKSGLAGMVGGGIDDVSLVLSGGTHSPYASLAVIWLITGVLTLMISNVAAAVVVLPIAQHLATLHQVSDRPFIMAVVYSASLALATPMGYQTNVLVWNPGGYRFVDFVRFGLPLQLLLFAVGVALLPWFFPFQQAAGG